MGEEEKIIIEAKQGNANAQFLLGLMYSVGKGIPRDDQDAFYWLTESAEQGNAEAQLHLGLVYENGKGTLQDYEKALYWFTKSAEQGDAEAQLSLGVMYANNGILQKYFTLSRVMSYLGARTSRPHFLQ